MLRATEYTGASGVYAIRYYTYGKLSPENHRNYCVLDSLQVRLAASNHGVYIKIETTEMKY